MAFLNDDISEGIMDVMAEEVPCKTNRERESIKLPVFRLLGVRGR